MRLKTHSSNIGDLMFQEFDSLFCDDDSLDRCLDMTIAIHGDGCKCPAHRGAL